MCRLMCAFFVIGFRLFSQDVQAEPVITSDAAQAHGKGAITVVGIAQPGRLHPIQEAILDAARRIRDRSQGAG